MRGLVGRILYWLGIKPNVTHNIAGGVSAGYGDMDINGFFQYPIDPSSITPEKRSTQ